jgi:hypothetical protein
MSIVSHIFNKESLGQIQIEDIKKLIENKIEEFLHLDYESIPAIVQYDGLAKHISGFLNTAGGIVVFGVSEERQRIPFRITWATIKKETLESNLYQKINPWYEGIKIRHIQNPNNDAQRIFVILVPKSKRPPHMANHTYYIRLNFQTKPISHEQVSRIFRQHYLQKYDLINKVYGPIYNELASYYNETRIRKWRIQKYREVENQRLFLLHQAGEISFDLDVFYHRIAKWNEAANKAPFRLAKIINDVASRFFNKQVYQAHGHSSIRIDIRAESTHQFWHIDQAVLNGKDPIDFWKEDNPFAQILEIKIELHLLDETGKKDFTTMEIPEEEFKKLIHKDTQTDTQNKRKSEKLNLRLVKENKQGNNRAGSSVWYERRLRKAEAAGSNPARSILREPGSFSVKEGIFRTFWELQKRGYTESTIQGYSSKLKTLSRLVGSNHSESVRAVIAEKSVATLSKKP